MSEGGQARRAATRPSPGKPARDRGAEAAGVGRPEVVAKPETQPVRHAAGETVPGWTRLIDTLMSKAPRVGACLMNGLPSLDQESGRLTIAFAPDKSFQVSSISDEGPTIAEAAAKILGRPIKVDLVLGDRGQREETKEEIRQVCTLAITTLGMPAAMAGFSWVNDVIDGDEASGDKR